MKTSAVPSHVASQMFSLDEVEITSEMTAEQRLNFAAYLFKFAERVQASALQLNPELEKIVPVQIPKGFVLVNLSEREKKQLRDLARKSGLALRDALRCALVQTRTMLQQEVRMTELLGKTKFERWREFQFASDN